VPHVAAPRDEKEVLGWNGPKYPPNVAICESIDSHTDSVPAVRPKPRDRSDLTTSP
jgi:hypothetical protein